MNAILKLDEQLFRAVHVGLRREWLDPIMVMISWTGLGSVQGALIALLLLHRPARPYALAAFAAGAAAGLLRLGVMRYADRMRPSNFDFASPLEQVFGNTGYPSGHTSTSFAIAFVVALIVRGTDRAWVGWLLFLWACLVGLSRMYVGVHFASDVLGGIGMGLVGASLVYLFWNAKGWLSLGADREQAADGLPRVDALDSLGNQRPN